jgi:hypothetical protein
VSEMEEAASAARLLDQGRRACERAARDLQDTHRDLVEVATEAEGELRSFHLKALAQSIEGGALVAGGEGVKSEVAVKPGGPADGLIPDRFTLGSDTAFWRTDAISYLADQDEDEPGGAELRALVIRASEIVVHLETIARQLTATPLGDVAWASAAVERAADELARLARDPRHDEAL